MRHIVTGGSGFTGGYLTAALAGRGEAVIVFDQAQPTSASAMVDFVKGDVRNPSDLKKLNLGPDDAVYHLAARQFHLGVPHANRDEWFADVNVMGTRRLLDAMAVGGARRIVFFSTDMTYGIPDLTPVPPSHPQRPIGPYGRSKVAAERLLVQAGGDFGLKATIFRPRLISGSGRLGILTKLFRLIKAGLPVPLIGSGRNRYQMVAVEDCVGAALAAAARDFPPGPFNLGSRDPPTVRDLLRGLIKSAGSRSMLIPTPAALLQPVLSVMDQLGLTLLYPEQFAIADRDYILDTESTRAALDWNPAKSDSDIIFEAYAAFLRLQIP